MCLFHKYTKYVLFLKEICDLDSRDLKHVRSSKIP